MKCQVCKEEIADTFNSVVCSDNCNEVRLKIIELASKFFPANGCPNCRGDLHQGCTEICKKETLDRHRFAQDLWLFVRFIYS